MCDLVSSTDANSKPEDEKEVDINECLKACGFGRFNIKFLFVAMLGCIADVAVANTTSFLLPSAECDLNMSLVQKGVLNAASYSGMMFSTIAAGFLTDTFGRKIFVQLGYGGIFFFTFIAGTSQTYEVLVAAKFFGGLLFASSYNATISLMAELCHNGLRDVMLIIQASFTAISQVAISGVSWAVLTQDWEYTLFDGKIVLHTWSFYLFLMSLWSLATSILYTLLIPESPKYLMTQNKYAEAKAVLIKIFKENTGQAADKYPYSNIWTKEIKAASESRSTTKTSFFKRLVTGLHNAKPMFRRPLGFYLVLLCLNMFLSLSLYNIMRLWFPQVSTVVEHYSSDENVDLCAMLDAYARDSKLRSSNITIDQCIPVKSGPETFMNSMIIGGICFVPFFLTSYLVSKFGKNTLLGLGGLICASVTLGLRWVHSTVGVVALFATNICSAQMLITLNQAFVIQLFPSSSSTLGIGMVMMAGRLGTLFGNIIFPMMLELKCELPFFFLSSIMLCVIVISYLLPREKKT